jgi:hypothetical protein
LRASNKRGAKLPFFSSSSGGWKLGRTKTFVGTSITRAIEDELIPDSIRTAIETSVIKNRDLAENVVSNLAESLGAKPHRMHDFANRGLYTFGLPSGAYFTPSETAIDTVEDVLRSIEGPGPTIALKYLHYGSPNSLHFGWTRLVSTYGYNPSTNQLDTLTATKGSPVFLENMVVVTPLSQASVVDTSTLNQWGISPLAGPTPDRAGLTGAAAEALAHSPVQVSEVITEDVVKVTYVWGLPGALSRESITIPVTGLSSTANYFHAAYTSGSTLKWFFYEDGQGGYPTLDQLFDAPPGSSGTFFPFVYFRYEKKSEIDDKTTARYKTSKKIMNKLGMNYDQVAKAINENPDITDVEQAIMMMAVPANTENELERRYLWEFFNGMYLSRAITPPAETRQLGGFSGSGMAIQDTRFKMWLENSGLTKRTVTGSIGPVGSHDSSFQPITKSITAVDEVTGSPVVLTTETTAHFYRRQVTATTYEELEVESLKTIFEILQGYSAIADEEDPILIVPLNRAITNGYPLNQREELYSRSLHYVFNSKVTRRLKWYQGSVFRAVMIIILIIITIATKGATAKELAAYIAAGSYLAAATLILIEIGLALIFRAVFKFLVRVLGVKAAFVLAIIAAALGVVDALESGSLAGAPFASELLAVSTGLTTAINKELQSSMVDLAKEYEVFQDWKEEQEKVLKVGKDLLGEITRLSPFIIFGEEPDEYYNRTAHSGNIGVLSIDAISQFVEGKLRLPELKDTFGGLNDD